MAMERKKENMLHTGYSSSSSTTIKAERMVSKQRRDKREGKAMKMMNISASRVDEFTFQKVEIEQML